jgi:predicted cupin superfamily sugar epimerase
MAPLLTAERVIELLGLEPLPVEGGYYRQTYHATELIGRECLPERYSGPRPYGSGIYYLLEDQTFSALHRLRSDEIYHFYLGQPVELLLLHPDGRDEVIVLGPDLAAGQRPQAVVPLGVWQGSRLLAPTPGAFALMGTTMDPAYDPADFELGERAALIAAFPQRAELIRTLTP